MKAVLREDSSMLLLMHLSQLINLFTVIGGLVVPLVIWLTKKDEIYGVDEQGKAILNFQISMYLYGIICVPLVLLLGLGLLGLLVIGLFTLIFPIINAIKANNREPISYPFTINFIK